MAYQNVGTPRFYIDSGLYQQAIGVWTPQPDQVSLVQLNPTNSVSAPANIEVPRISPIRYVAILGHNGGSYSASFNETEMTDLSEVVNMSGADTDLSGFSIGTFGDMEIATSLTVDAPEGSTIGAVSIGNYYDMPHSPDLNLKLSYDYDGIKNLTTKGGATLSNASYIKPADWGNGMGAWQLGDNPNYRSGRRVWGLSFSYLSDSDIFPVNATTSNPLNTNPDDDTLLDGTDFFSVVWNRTMGGHLPFIFQPDKDNSNPDQFAIARFDMNSLQYDQVANNVYNVKLKIRESW